MCAAAAVSFQINQAETMTCYQYGIKVHGTHPLCRGRVLIQEIFVPPPYSLCFNKYGSFFVNKARNVYKENEFSDDAPEIESPLIEVQISKSLIDQIRNLVEQKQKIKDEEASVNAQLKQFWE